MAIAAYKVRGMMARMAPEYRHLVPVMADLGWRTGRPTDVQRLPRVFFRDLDNRRWEVKRSPQGNWRIRYVYEVHIYGIGWVPSYYWWFDAPVFDNPASAALWFDRCGVVLLKYGVNLKCA